MPYDFIYWGFTIYIDFLLGLVRYWYGPEGIRTLDLSVSQTVISVVRADCSA